MSGSGFLNALCYLGLLRFPERIEPAIALLPETEKSAALAILAEVKDLTKAELLRRWSQLRSEEYIALLRDCRNGTGICIDEIPSSVREQWVDWFTNHHD